MSLTKLLTRLEADVLTLTLDGEARRNALNDEVMAAFDATMKDPEYLADAKKLDIDVNPVSGKALDDLLAELYATPKDVLKKAGEAITK